MPVYILELIDLVRIPNVKGPRARLLHKAGFASIVAVASASPDEICQILKKDRPFVKSNFDEESIHDRIEMRVASSIISAAKEVLDADRRELERAIKSMINNTRRMSANL